MKRKGLGWSLIVATPVLAGLLLGLTACNTYSNPSPAELERRAANKVACEKIGGRFAEFSANANDAYSWACELSTP